MPTSRTAFGALSGLLAIGAAVMFLQCRPSESSRESEGLTAVRAVLKSQADAWNAGDVAKYMEGYAKEDSTTFVGTNKVTRGWQTVLDRYKTKYDTRDKMGALVFSDLDLRQTGDAYIFVTGQWRLTPKDGDVAQGRFTLLFRRIPAGWRIVYDHSS
jgi:ketosteroid isomerase-like protein